MALANGWLEQPSSGGPKVSHARAGIAAAVASVPQGSAALFETMLEDVYSKALLEERTEAGSLDSKEESRVLQGEVVVLTAPTAAALLQDPCLSQLLANVAELMSDSSAKFHQEHEVLSQIPTFDQFADGVYTDEDELKACRALRVVCPTWATHSQTLVVGCAGGWLLFAERHLPFTGPISSSWRWLLSPPAKFRITSQ